MSITDVLRPTAVVAAGGGVAVPGGTLYGVTSDDSDATYVQFPASAATWILQVGAHTPSAGYERHRVRARVRARTDAGTAFLGILVGNTATMSYTGGSVSLTASFADLPGSWQNSGVLELDTVGSLADLAIMADEVYGGAGGATEGRIAECYIDVDCRQQPQYSPQIRDAAGVDQAGGTITDTNQPTIYVGAVGFDGLPARDWTVHIYQVGNPTPVFTATGSGTPPTTVPLTISLADDSYSIEYTVRSTIRASTPFAHTQTLLFDVLNAVPPPPAPDVTITEQDGGYLVSWDDPGGPAWDDGYVVAEVYRDDCAGSWRIATVADGLTGSYLDLAMPQTDPQPIQADSACDIEESPCDITYRVRYWGFFDDVLTVSEFSSDTVEAVTYTDGLDRLATLDTILPVVTDRNHSFPRLVVDSIPLLGGYHTIATTSPGEDMSLTMATVGKAAIDELEALLSNDRVYYSPLGGQPGWYAPMGWQVSAPTAGVKVLQITMIRQPWPTTADPEDYL